MTRKERRSYYNAVERTYGTGPCRFCNGVHPLGECENPDERAWTGELEPGLSVPWAR